MNRYRVVWRPEAEAELADIWIQHPDKSAVAAAQHQIDRFLAADPAAHGQHLAEGLYRIVVPPLVAFFSFNAAMCVEVSNIDLARTRR